MFQNENSAVFYLPKKKKNKDTVDSTEAIMFYKSPKKNSNKNQGKDFTKGLETSYYTENVLNCRFKKKKDKEKARRKPVLVINHT